MKVFVHTRKGQQPWHNEIRGMAQIPRVGEYVTLDTASPFYLVKLVVHTPHGGAMDAEIFAEEADHLEAMRQVFGDKERGES